jgi:hypothetical protein
MRDLAHVETAERLERQNSLRFNRQVFIAAHEQHSQQVILDLRFGQHRHRRLGVLCCRFALAIENEVVPRAPAQFAEDIVARYTVQPCFGIVRQARARP